MKTIAINESLTVSFVCPLREYENIEILLRRLNFKYFSQDVTKQNNPLTYAEGRKEIEFLVSVKNLHEASILKTLIQRV